MDTPAEARIQTDELQQNLRCVTADRLSLTQQLFASSRILRVSPSSDSDTFRIVGVARSDDEESVELRGHQHTMQLSVTKYRGENRLGDRMWSDFRGDSRLLAWCLSHDLLIKNLQAILEQPLLPQRIGATFRTESSHSDVVTVGFDMSGDSGAVSIEGTMRVPMSWAKALVVRSSMDAADSSQDRFGELPIVMSLQIPGPQLSVPRLRDIGLGDTIVLGSSAAALNHIELRRGNAIWFRAAHRNNTLQITSRAFRDYQSVPEEYDVNIENTDSTETQADANASVPITLSFEVGALTLTLDEASKLQPGYIFALPEPAAGTNVRIRANGTVVGRGELVIVGETLGVSVTSWSDNGLQ